MPPGVVTTTSTGPAACAGVTTVASVAETTTRPVPAVPPNETCIPARRFVPVSVTVWPPVPGPSLGMTTVSDGAAT